MELLNTTKKQAGYSTALQADGRDVLVVAIKGTYSISPNSAGEPNVSAEQVPLTTVDEFVGEPGLSAPLYEIDFAPHKPRCDVLLNGSAYAPRQRPTVRVKVGLKISDVTKAFDVVGNRVWCAGFEGIGPSDPEPFSVLPFSYQTAFGGIDRPGEDPTQHRWYPSNHVGVGYHEHLDPDHIDGKPLPNTEEHGVAIVDPRGNYRPMAFGPIGRAWRGRAALAGTYDGTWLNDRAPFLPTDFDERYYQAAPEDQQMDYPAGGENVELFNLTPEGHTVFKLPALNMPVSFRRRDGSTEVIAAVVDTIVIEPDRDRFMLTWRAATHLRRSIHEMEHVVVGKTLRDHQSAIPLPKRRFRSLNDLAEWRRRAKGLGT